MGAGVRAARADLQLFSVGGQESDRFEAQAKAGEAITFVGF